MKNEKKFFAAARVGDVEEVRRCLESGIPVDYYSKWFYDKNLWGTPGRTALMWAVVKGHFELVKLLLDLNASPNKREFFPDVEELQLNTCWSLAAGTNRAGILKLLLKSADNPQSQFLIDAAATAAAHGYLEIVKFLIESGVEINAFSSDGQSLLMAAAHRGRPNVVKWLTASGAIVDLYDEGDEESEDNNADCYTEGLFAGTALHHAILGLTYKDVFYDEEGNIVAGPSTDDYLECLRLLLDAGADPNAEQKGAGYPIEMVNGYPAARELLISAGADPSCTE